jgi:nucleoside 2-deoxyribosyltransferase
MAFANALAGMKECDVVFAWIESKDCYGTLVEIGYANALGKPVFIACKDEPDSELWFAFKMDTYFPEVRKFESVESAFDLLLQTIAIVGVPEVAA